MKDAYNAVHITLKFGGLWWNYVFTQRDDTQLGET